jgi:hypothetical protein
MKLRRLESSSAFDLGGTGIRRVTGGWLGRGVAAPGSRVQGTEKMVAKICGGGEMYILNEEEK